MDLTTQTNTSNALKALDCISRQAAIDAFRKELATGESKGNYVTICSAISYEGAKQILESLPSAQLYTDEEVQKMQDMEQAQIEKAFDLGREDAQQEIIRCKDCKCFAGEGMYCDWDIMVHYDHFYCYHAERREE